jgi:endoglucanase
MLTARFRMKGIAIFATATLALAMTATPTLAGSAAFYVPPPDKSAVTQIKDLVKQGNRVDAALLTAMVANGHAVWFTGGTPTEVQKQVKKTMRLAHAQHAVPVLVAYNLPFRDCGQYSAGGAVNTADYEAWIDAFAAGIGTGKALVILEPDGLGIIPYNNHVIGKDLVGNDVIGMEWCQPDLTGTGLTPETANAARYEQLNYAVTRLGQQANVSVYLDGTHSAWLGVGDIAQRLVKAGVQRAEGFFLNVSNYQFTANSIQYGTWISQCIASGSYGGCPNQYYNGGPLPAQIAVLLGEWQGGALSPYGVWSDSTTQANANLNTSGLNLRYAAYPAGKTHFVIDTSRNGQGPWSGTLDWCNPPGRGLGIAPTTNTGSNALVDAYLWVKVPGESDGSCARPAGGTTDVEWGNIVDPAAGAWFPQQALQLAQLADPPLH